MTSDYTEESSSDSDRDRHHRKHHKKKKHRRKHHKKHRKSSRHDRDKESSRKKHYSDDDSSSHSSEDYRRSKRRKKSHKRSKNERRHSSMKRQEKDESTKQENKFDKLLPQLHALLSQHPDLATELPYYLIRVASGSSINLSQVPVSLGLGLRNIFQTLGCTCTNDEWKFDDGGNMKRMTDENALVLIKLTRHLMDDKGFTIDAIQKFENDAISPALPPIQKKEAVQELQDVDVTSEISLLTSMLLEKFQKEGNDKKSSFAKELYDILTMISEQEIINLDGLPDESLKTAMEKLFLIIGLSREEMDDDSDSEDNDTSGQDKEKSYGYVLPDESFADFERIKTKLDAAITACKATHQSFIQNQTKKRIMGPSIPTHTETSMQVSAFDLDEDDSDDDIGPSPFGTEVAKHRRSKLSSEEVKLMAAEREANMMHVTTGVDPNSTHNSGGREEWMLQAGEHDFLKGILSKGIKSRTFKNEKGGNKDISAPEVPLDPKVQQEVDNIIKMHEEARGPSLMDQHRQQKAEDKEAKRKGDGQDWTWNRESDLDKGRRVDKSHLRMVLGGASSDLKSKFQGSYSKSFT